MSEFFLKSESLFFRLLAPPYHAFLQALTCFGSQRLGLAARLVDDDLGFLFRLTRLALIIRQQVLRFFAQAARFFAGLRCSLLVSVAICRLPS